ncbi:hypothetical protein BJX66DRAFT_144469 [Aspergillus keveii]|uniref:Uncharacterized protein n=1 Tax=Aspergillus keveii TaxID=714993 RepID=A0ABR4GAK3_9EURO
MRHLTSRLISFVYPSRTRVVNNCLTNAPIIRSWAFLAAWLMPEPRGAANHRQLIIGQGSDLPHQDRLSLISVSPAGGNLQALVTPSRRGDDSTRSPAYLHSSLLSSDPYSYYCAASLPSSLSYSPSPSFILDTVFQPSGIPLSLPLSAV